MEAGWYRFLTCKSPRTLHPYALSRKINISLSETTDSCHLKPIYGTPHDTFRNGPRLDLENLCLRALERTFYTIEIVTTNYRGQKNIEREIYSKSEIDVYTGSQAPYDYYKISIETIWTRVPLYEPESEFKIERNPCGEIRMIYDRPDINAPLPTSLQSLALLSYLTKLYIARNLGRTCNKRKLLKCLLDVIPITLNTNQKNKAIHMRHFTPYLRPEMKRYKIDGAVDFMLLTHINDFTLRRHVILTISNFDNMSDCLSIVSKEIDRLILEGDHGDTYENDLMHFLWCRSHDDITEAFSDIIKNL